MSKTIELRKLIKLELLKLCERVYYQEADSKAKYPYIVYEFSNSIKNYSRDDISLTVDIWDKNEESSNVEILADNCEKLFFNTDIHNEKVYPTLYLDVRNTLKDEDKLIRRRQLKFTI